MARGRSAIRWALVIALGSGVAAQGQAPERDPGAAAISRLINAVIEGNEVRVREALVQGVSPVGEIPAYCGTALSKAAELGRLDILKLLNAKADVNAHDPMCPAALHFAALNGRREAVRMLLAAGADPNIRSGPAGSAGQIGGGDTALLAALRGGYREVASDLIEAGASVLIPSKRRESTLLVAAQHNDAEIVEALMRKGADPHLPTVDGLTPVAAAAANGNARILQLLLAQGVNVDEPAQGGITPLMRAVELGHAESIRVLLTNGADAMASGNGVRGGRGGTVLDVAIDNGQAGAVELLLAGPLRLPHKVEVKASSGIGDAPLIPPPPEFPAPAAALLDEGLRLAAEKKQTAIVKLLLEGGADVKAEGECGRTALMEAADSGDTEAAALLLKAGANAKSGETVDALKGCTGWNVLMAALGQGRLKMVNALLDSGAGALVNRHNVSGKTALDLLPATSAPPSPGLKPNPEMTEEALKAVRQRLEKEAAMQAPDLALAEPVFRYDTGGGEVGRIVSQPALERIQTLAPAAQSRGAEATLRARIARGRADFEKYHGRLITGRFKEITTTVLETDVRFIRPEIAMVRFSWTAQGDVNPDASARPRRFGLMTMVVEKRNGTWLVIAVQNVNAPIGGARTPEAQDIKSPIVVPRGSPQ